MKTTVDQYSAQIKALNRRAKDALTDQEISEFLESHQTFLKQVSETDLPQLVNVLQSIESDWWLRELMAEIITSLDQASALPSLIEAYDKNLNEGHDNDGFTAFITAMIEKKPDKFRNKLEELLATDHYAHQETARWLLEACSD